MSAGRRQQVISVNGCEHHVLAPPECPLLYVLADELALSGPRLGCGAGDCGSCAVLVDGREARSCRLLVGDVSGAVITLEGLSSLSEHELHPVQQAWIDEQVPQCGYCQNGMIIAAVSLLTHTPEPSVAQIKAAFTHPHPHLCRCGTYAAIIRAVQRAARASV